nr:disintegrin and metalloproteinase domain-containing protein 15-like isoform X1 [Pogona vitticeps]
MRTSVPPLPPACQTPRTITAPPLSPCLSLSLFPGGTPFSLQQPAPPGAPRPDPPSKPLPPDPVPKGRQALLQDRPAPPTRPLPADPIPKNAQAPSPAKPPPPRKPLPSDPLRAEPCVAPCYDPRVQMLPSRPAPPPPPTATGSSTHVHEI